MIQELTKRASEDLDNGEAHLEYVAQWVEGGQTILELAKSMSESIPNDPDIGRVKVEPRWITRHLIDKYGRPEYDRRMAEARSIGSYAMVEDARAIADDTPMDRDAVAQSKLRMDQRHWTAERFNKQLGTRNIDLNANVNVQSLHLDALRARSIARATATMLPPTSENGVTEGLTAPAPAFLSGVSKGHTSGENVITDVITPSDDES